MEIYITRGVEQFITSLEASEQARALCAIDLLGNCGAHFQKLHSQMVVKGLWELSILGRHHAADMRMFYCIEESVGCLLHGYYVMSDELSQFALRCAISKWRRLRAGITNI